MRRRIGWWACRRSNWVGELRSWMSEDYNSWQLWATSRCCRRAAPSAGTRSPCTTSGNTQFCHRYYDHHSWRFCWQLLSQLTTGLLCIHRWRCQNWCTRQEVREGHDGREGGRAGQGAGDLRAAAPHQGGQVHHVLVLDVHLAPGHAVCVSEFLFDVVFIVYRFPSTETLDSS